MTVGTLALLYATSDGTLYEDPEIGAAGWDGARVKRLDESNTIPLPEGADLMLLPARDAVGWDASSGRAVRDIAARRSPGEPLYAVAATLPSGYTRTLLPAYQQEGAAPRLPLFGYTAVGARDGEPFVAAMATDEAYRWNPALYNDLTLPRRIKALRKRFPANRLVDHLARCAMEYHCLTAQNMFYGRWEAGLPTAPSCNAACLGCISLQPAGDCPSPQERIKFIPTVDEIVELMVMHLSEAAGEPIVSFGQGCEGEPLTQGRLLAEAVAKTRAATARGTINLNTNAGATAALRAAAEAGLDSVRVSLISAREETYRAYHCPRTFTLDDVRSSLAQARELGVYTSLNLLVMPGLTDRAGEVEALEGLLDEGTVDMVQLRNLNIDPAALFSALPGRRKEPLLGLPALIARLRARPGLAVGSYTHPPVSGL